MSFSRLPDELQLLVLSYLPFRHIARYRLICRHIRALIDSSRELAFTIELGAAGVKNNPACPDSMYKKVNQLIRSNVAWANLHWQYRREVEVCGTGKIYDLSDGCFFHTAAPPTASTDQPAKPRHGTAIDWFKLPSRREPNPNNKPSRLAFDVPLTDFVVDASRDLIIGIELTSFTNSRNSTVICNLYPRSISTSKVHPEAARPAISMRFVSPVVEFEPVVQVCGSHIGILFTRRFGIINPASFDMFLLLDWTTGVQKSNMSSYTVKEYWETFCFLTPESVLMPSACNYTLNIFHFDDTPNSLKHTLSLLLPEPLEDDGLRHIYVRSQPTPAAFSSTTHPAGDIPPFTADPDEAIVVLSMDYRLYISRIDQGHNSPQVAAIPRRILNYFASLARTNANRLTTAIETFHHKLFNEASATDIVQGMTTALHCTYEERHMHASIHPRDKRFPHLHADQWVLHSRWGLDSVTPSLGSFAYGSRYLGMSSRIKLPSTPASSVVVYDFNLCNERRGLILDQANVRPYPEPDELFNEDQDWDYDENTGDKRWPVYPSRIVVEPTIVDIPDVFKQPFTTALPYRATETEMVLPWDSAMIDGERIIGLEFMDAESGSIDTLDVIVI